ncbi:MAG: YraN family protein [Desulfovibrio sp.]|nr:YraN family protein [Desulfovibrio sp.]
MNLRRLFPGFFDKIILKEHPEQTDLRKDTGKKPATAAHLQLGKEGEDAAAILLTRKGYALLDRNWRKARLELDMVCRDGDTIVFVEVKTRGSDKFGGPTSAISLSKQRTLCRAARAWLAAHAAWDQPCRFDVICALRDGSTLHLEHFCHAFDCPPALDSSHSSWQPW